MAIQRTFSIIKPDATERNLTGAVNKVIEEAGLRIVAQKRIQMTRGQAETFYAVHKERPFFGELVDFMTSGPVVVQVLEGENAVQRYRDMMGATNPANAAEGTAAGPEVAASIIAEAGRHIARYKLPKDVLFRDRVLRSPSGKADYRWAKAEVS